jgi:hypothetical protein
VIETTVDKTRSTAEKKIVVVVPVVATERSPRTADTVRSTIEKIMSLDDTVAAIETSHGKAAGTARSTTTEGAKIVNLVDAATVAVIERSHRPVDTVGSIIKEKSMNLVATATVAAVERSRGTADAVGSTIEGKTVNRDDVVPVVIMITAMDATAD